MKRIYDDSRPDPGRILVYMPTWVGDVVMATPFLRELRGRFAQAHIALLIRSSVREVLTGGPWMNEVIELTRRGSPLRSLGNLRRTAQRLRAGRFDWAVLLANSFRSALTARWARIPRRVGYDRDGRGWLLTDGVPTPRENGRLAMISTVHYYNALAEALGCNRPNEALELATITEDERAVDNRLSAWGICDHHPLVVINPGASFGPSKLWPPQRYAEVADRLVGDADARVVVTFGPGEKHLAQQVQTAMSQPSYLVDNPCGTLGQLKALIRRCDLLLNNDTGPRHFAKAFKRPVVTVFGSTAPEWTDTDYRLERKVRIDVDCGPCQKKICPLGHHKCMTGVTSNMVYEAAAELLRVRRTAKQTIAT